MENGEFFSTHPGIISPLSSVSPADLLQVRHSSRVLGILGVLGMLGESGQRKGFSQGHFFAHPGAKNSTPSTLSTPSSPVNPLQVRQTLHKKNASGFLLETGYA